MVVNEIIFKQAFQATFLLTNYISSITFISNLIIPESTLSPPVTRSVVYIQLIINQYLTNKFNLANSESATVFQETSNNHVGR